MSQPWMVYLQPWVPLVLTLVFILVSVAGWRYFGRKASKHGSGHLYQHQAWGLALGVMAVLAVVISAPMHDELRGQLLSLISILLSATIALSSTSFMGNLFAGAMLRAIGDFSIGDFIEVDGDFGRVTERGLLHVEIQTETSDLTTIPNLRLVSSAVTVTRASGTIVSADVSLGYDVSRRQVDVALIEAAERCELEDPFVHIRELGDFSIVYRIAGRLKDTTQLLTARSRLRAHMLDTLHRKRIEIVSPAFMNQKQVTRDVLPADYWRDEDPESESPIESMVFDKAERAVNIDNFKQRKASIKKRIAELQPEFDVMTEGDDQYSLAERRLSMLNKQYHRVSALLEMLMDETSSEG